MESESWALISTSKFFWTFVNKFRLYNRGRCRSFAVFGELSLSLARVEGVLITV